MAEMRIVATNGQQIIVDEETYRWFGKLRWHIRNGYACCGKCLMHRLVIDAPHGLLVDHINRNRLDNRKENLRLATPSQNNVNMPLHGIGTTSSKYRGVFASGRKNKIKQTKRPWRSRIRDNGNQKQIGYFKTQLEAALAYDKEAKSIYGEFATLNFPEKFRTMGDDSE